MFLVSKVKSTLLSYPFVRRLHEMRLEPLRLIYKPGDLTEAYYAKAKESGDPELEHQIGRLTNFKKIVGEIAEHNLPGDVLEFGTWKGFSLHWFAYLIERAGIFDKKIVGIDGFIGLPNSEGVFTKLQFKDASLKGVRRSLKASHYLYDITKRNMYVEKFLFEQKTPILSRLTDLGVTRACLVHLDADLSTSTEHILDVLLSGSLLNDTCYLLFDDWGCDTGLSNAVEQIFKKSFGAWNIVEHSSTRFTKNFKLRKK